MKRQQPSTAQCGHPSPSSNNQVRGCEPPRIRYAVGRMILDQAGERFIGFRIQDAFVWADADVADRFVTAANDPQFRIIRA